MYDIGVPGDRITDGNLDKVLSIVKKGEIIRDRIGLVKNVMAEEVKYLQSWQIPLETDKRTQQFGRESGMKRKMPNPQHDWGQIHKEGANACNIFVTGLEVNIQEEG